MNANTDLMQERCEQCGRLRMHSVHILSRHATSDGTVVYAQCVCGLLAAWLYPLGDEATVVAHGTG